MHKKAHMQRAINLAREKMREGKGHWPFGCLIVKDGEVVGEACNDMGISLDPTAHGEILAIRDACKRLGTMDLSGCELYTSCEPCSLCTSAIFLTNISKVYYGAVLDDCRQYGSDHMALRDYVSKPIDRRATPSERLLGEEGRALLGEWAAMIEESSSLQEQRNRHPKVGERGSGA